MSVIFTDCADCKNFEGELLKKQLKCKAFPRGIPKEWFLKGDPKEKEFCNKENKIGFEPE